MITTTRDVLQTSIDDLIIDPELGWLNGRLNHLIQGDLKLLRLLMTTREELSHLLQDDLFAGTVETWIEHGNYRLRPEDVRPLDVVKMYVPDLDTTPVRDLIMIDLQQPTRRIINHTHVARVVEALSATLNEPLTFEHFQLFSPREIMQSVTNYYSERKHETPWNGIDMIQTLASWWGYRVSYV